MKSVNRVKEKYKQYEQYKQPMCPCKPDSAVVKCPQNTRLKTAVHFHTNEPRKLLEYCASLGEIYDIVVEDMDRQARGFHG